MRSVYTEYLAYAIYFMKRFITFLVSTTILLALLIIAFSYGAKQNNPTPLGILNRCEIYDGKIYFIDKDGILNVSSLKESGADSYPLSDGVTVDFDILEGKLYYINFNDRKRLYSVNLGTNVTEKISDHTFKSLQVHKGLAYAISETHANHLYRMALDGTGLTQVVGASCYDFAIVEGKVYYLWQGRNNTEGYFFSRANLDGDDQHKLLETSVLAADFDDDWLYYSDQEGVHRAAYDGKNREVLSDSLSYNLKKIDDQLYFTQDGEAAGLYRIQTDGFNKEKVADGPSVGIDVVDGWLLYLNFGDEKIKFIEISDNYVSGDRLPSLFLKEK